jgi:hypothetical protein
VTGKAGNVMGTSGRLAITIRDAGGTIGWQLNDWTGRTVQSGSVAAASGGDTPLSLANPGPGYYELTIACSAGCPATTALAVVPNPPASRPRPFGVMTHVAHGWSQEFVPLIARAGIGNVRDEQYWQRVEQQRSVYAVPEAWASYLTKLKANGIVPLLEMTFGNPLYDGGSTPTSSEAQLAYGRYGRAIAAAGGVRTVEVWNEINGSWCSGGCPADPVGTYLGLLQAAKTALKSYDPSIQVVGGVTAGIPLPFWQQLIDRGALPLIDVASVHVYPDQPEGAESDITALRAMMAAAGGQRPIWVTETGHGGSSPAQRRDTAAWLLRQMTLLRSVGVERIYWYLMRDIARFEGMGLVRATDSSYGANTPNPAYVAYATLIRTLGNAAPVRREATTDGRTRIYLFNAGGKSIRVAWTTAGAATVKLCATGTLTRVDPMGRSSTIAAAGGAPSVALSMAPVFLVGAATVAGETGANRQLADSRLDFTVDGSTGQWRYGYVQAAVGQPSTGTFVPMVKQSDAWSYYWGDPRYHYLALTRDNTHPEVANGLQIRSVRRWISPVTGTVTITGEAATAASPGDGTETQILIDGAMVAQRTVRPGERQPFAVTVPVHVGSAVDFVVTPGPELDIGWDATSFFTVITIAGTSNPAACS